jgi:hypothetical protein
VIVLDNGGRENATVWGDILTWVAHRRGIAGTVIDGACRDTSLCRELGYPVYSRSYSMRTGKDRVQVEAMNVVVNIGDARVAPGDLLRGDADGVLVIPRAHEEAVLAAAEEIDAIEQRIRAALNEGKTLADARRELGGVGRLRRLRGCERHAHFLALAPLHARAQGLVLLRDVELEHVGDARRVREDQPCAACREVADQAVERDLTFVELDAAAQKAALAG